MIAELSLWCRFGLLPFFFWYLIPSSGVDKLFMVTSRLFKRSAFPHLLFSVSSQIESTEFICCKETVDEYLSSLEFSMQTNTVYILHATDLKLRFYEDCWKITRRRTDQTRKRKKGSNSGWEMDDFYDGFGCLYNEGLPMEVEVGGSGDSNGPLQAKITPCPPLQPLLN